MEGQYLDTIRNILDGGKVKSNRTGVKTLYQWGNQMRFNLSDGSIPLLTIRKINWEIVLDELLFFLRGDTNTKLLKSKIWEFNTSKEFLKSRGLNYPEGEMGPGYGFQWRHWNGEFNNSNKISGIDQIKCVIESIKKDPSSRRHIVSAWNPEQIDQMALPPCHILFQFDVYDGKLSIAVVQRSADMPIGVPFNIASYAMLCHIIANLTGLKPGELVYTTHDTHIYENQIEACKIMLSRSPLTFPKFIIKGQLELDKITIEQFGLEDYKPHPHIKIPMS